MAPAESRGEAMNKGKAANSIKRSPISWVGGKYYLANKLIPLFPEHTTYVEVFGGERSSTNMYKRETTGADHERLIDCLLKIKGKAMLSGYDNGLYDRLGWRKALVGESAIAVQKRIGGERLKKNEYVWVNY